MHRRVGFAPLLSLAGLALAAAAPALAQDGNVMIIGGRAGGDDAPSGMFFSTGGPVGFAELMRPDFQRRDLPLIVGGMSLDEGQGIVLEALLEQYRAEFDLLVEKLKDAQRRFTPPEMRMALDDMNRMTPATITFGNDGEGFAFFSGEPIELTLDGGEGGAVGTIAIAMTIGGPDDGAEGPTAGAPPAGDPGAVGNDSVQIDVTDADGNSIIPPEALQAMQRNIEEHMRRVEERLKKYREEAEKEGPPPTPEELAEIARSVRVDKEALRTRFQTDVELLLNDAQAEFADPTFRHVRRDHLLRFGELSGESLDLFRVLRDLGLLDAIDLAEYEARLDELLQARHSTLADREVSRPAEGLEEDRDARLHHEKRMADRRVSVRDLNDAEVERIALALDEETAARLRDEARRVGYPSIFRPSTVVALHDRALELPDLDDETRDAIVAARDAYAAALAVRNEALLAITRDSEPERTVRMLEHMQQIEQGGDFQSLSLDDLEPASERMRERSEAAMKARQQLESILGKERFEALPGARPRGLFRLGTPRG